MKKGRAFCWILALFLAATGNAFAQEAPLPTFDLLGNVSQKVTYRAAEWDAVAASTWTFGAALRPQFTYGALTFTADSLWTLPLNASLTPVAPTLAIPEAYFRWAVTDALDLTFGQKRFNIGVGQTFTVGDSLNPATGFFDQKTGFRGVTAEWSPASWASAAVAVSTEGGRADALAGAGQVNLLLGNLQVTGSVVAQGDKTLNPALGVSVDLLGVIVTAEAAAEFLPQGLRASNPPATSASAGARWMPTWGDWDLTLAAEYLYWAQGLTDDESAAGISAVVISPAFLLRSQHNAFVRLAVSTGGVFTVSTFCALDLQDGSILGQVSATLTPWDNLDVTANLQAAQGESQSAWEFLGPLKDRYQASVQTTYHY